MVPLKYLRNFSRTIETPLFNREIDSILNWSANIFIRDDPINNQVSTFALTDIKLHVPVITFST